MAVDGTLDRRGILHEELVDGDFKRLSDSVKIRGRGEALQGFDIPDKGSRAANSLGQGHLGKRKGFPEPFHILSEQRLSSIALFHSAGPFPCRSVSLLDGAASIAYWVLHNAAIRLLLIEIDKWRAWMDMLKVLAINDNALGATAASSSRQFPDDDTYRYGLEEHQLVLLECFKEAIRKTHSSKTLAANPIHSSIAVPVIAQPKDDENKVLCRILTVDSDENGVPLDHFVLYLERKPYTEQIETVSRIIRELPLHATLARESGDAGLLFHGNGIKNEHGYRIIFDSVALERGEIVTAFVKLIDNLNGSYQET
jgi:hypothetical protein